MPSQKQKNKYYFLGIKGVGMTMLAQFLHQSGQIVTGSDVKETFLTDTVLRKEKIRVLSPFNPKNIPASLDVIVYSSAFTASNNPEMKFISENPERFKNVRLLSYAEALGEIFSQHRGLAVCGSHGKTTTSAWLGYVLSRAGLQPKVLVGSKVPQFKDSSALFGSSDYFVAEVDEYQNKLQYFSPDGVILNNIEYDHPDFFKTEADYVKVFADFIKKIPAKGFLVANEDDKYVKKIKTKNKGHYLPYSLKQVKDISYQQGITSFKFKTLGEFKIRLQGEHNISNALAVILSAKTLGVSVDKIKKYLLEFKGTARRAEVLGKYKGAIIIDDYAHHPTEIKATLKAIRSAYPKKNIITLFHPHTYTRTKALFKDFVKSFSDTNELMILDIYGSAREKQGGVSSKQLAQAIRVFNKQNNLSQSVGNISDLKEAAKYFKTNLKPNDLLLLMGAGDVFRVGEFLFKSKV